MKDPVLYYILYCIVMRKMDFWVKLAHWSPKGNLYVTQHWDKYQAVENLPIMRTSWGGGRGGEGVMYSLPDHFCDFQNGWKEISTCIKPPVKYFKPPWTVLTVLWRNHWISGLSNYNLCFNKIWSVIFSPQEIRWP